MCGIIGCAGRSAVLPVLVPGIRLRSHRGRDVAPRRDLAYTVTVQ